MSLDIKILRGKFELQVLNSDGTVDDSKSRKFSNTILEAFVNEITGGSGTSVFSSSGGQFAFCRVGTGTDPITYTTEHLGNEIATSMRVDNLDLQTQEIEGVNYVIQSGRYVFDLGSVVGNISEIGMTLSNGSVQPLMSGQLIKDELGNIDPIVVGADQQLIVNYTVGIQYFTQDLEIDSGTVDDGTETGTMVPYTLYAIGSKIFQVTGSSFTISLPYPTSSYRACRFRVNGSLLTNTFCRAKAERTLDGIGGASYECDNYIIPSAGTLQVANMEFAPVSSSTSGSIMALKITFDTPLDKPSEDRFRIGAQLNVSFTQTP